MGRKTIYGFDLEDHSPNTLIVRDQNQKEICTFTVEQQRDIFCKVSCATDVTNEITPCRDEYHLHRVIEHYLMFQKSQSTNADHFYWPRWIDHFTLFFEMHRKNPDWVIVAADKMEFKIKIQYADTGYFFYAFPTWNVKNQMRMHCKLRYQHDNPRDKQDVFVLHVSDAEPALEMMFAPLKKRDTTGRFADCV